MNYNQLPSIDWQAVIADAVDRLEWVRGQSADAVEQSRLLEQAGDGSPVEAAPLPKAIADERRKAFTRERMARMLGMPKAGRWAARATGSPAGVFDPATVTAAEAAGVLEIVRRYVRRHSGPTSQYRLSPEGQDDAVSRIVAAIWTRDYTRSNVGAGNLSGAVWQACSLYRRTAWIGEAVIERKAARRRKQEQSEAAEWEQRGHGDNPARIAAAIEAAEAGLAAPSTVNRGRKQTRRQRGIKRMPGVSAADARACLIGTGE